MALNQIKKQLQNIDTFTLVLAENDPYIYSTVLPAQKNSRYGNLSITIIFPNLNTQIPLANKKHTNTQTMKG